VRRPSLFQFRDEDGSYALVRPLDDARGRVVSSDLWEAGVILWKDPALTWEVAAALAGQGDSMSTRLGPHDFGLGSPKEGDLDREDFQGREENRVLFDLLGAVEEPEPEAPPSGPAERALPLDPAEDPPDDLLQHLVVHYLRITEPGHDDGRWERHCSCTPLKLPAPGARSPLRRALSAALRARGLPSLEAILFALRAIRARKEVEVA